MGWEITAYAIALSVIAIAAVVVVAVARAVRTLGKIERTITRLSGETESSLRQLRELAEEATAIARSGRQTFESIATFAEGARALGEAAQAAGETATRVSAYWRDRLSFRKAAETEAEEERPAGERIDWHSVFRGLLDGWRTR
ncbi:hypothetical protein [Cohnella panacarvi]|uniref:hypothetical protein n=1 Tax=Cohnella panacarvi TaxID=400776 RepID=UPI00047EFB1F|nr:hypothetical protein [Cohnella panacarvi]